MRRIIFVVVGGLALVTGFRVLAAPDCETVSFDGQGGRVALVVCHPDDTGVLPSTLVGLGLVVAGGAVVLTTVRRRR